MHLLRDILLVEGVQHTFTHSIPCLQLKDYAKHQRISQLESSELRRLKTDLIMEFKIIFGLVDLNTSDFFEISNTSTRSHPWKLLKTHANESVRKHYFSERVAIAWNSLPISVVGATSLNSFKRELDNCNLKCFLRNEE